MILSRRKDGLLSYSPLNQHPVTFRRTWYENGGVEGLKNREEIIRRMKEVRARLESLVAEGRVLTSEEVLAVSQELDRLVVAYQRWLLPNRARKTGRKAPVLSLQHWNRGPLRKIL